MRKGPLVLAVFVFLASLGTLAASTSIALWDSTDELAAGERLRTLASKLAAEARDVVETLPSDEPGLVLPEADNRRLTAVATEVLADYPIAEGGFYLADSDQFAGVVMTSPEPPAILDEKAAIEKGKKGKADKKGDAKGQEKKADSRKPEFRTPPVEPTKGRRDPPPLETDPIRRQARAALDQDAGSPPLLEIREIGPSRVAVATKAVGDYRPARVAVWAMIRLTGPQQQKARLGRLQLATGLATIGIVLALGLAVGLVRSLQVETHRRQQLRDELQKTEYMAALGRLLAGVAHEVRNPLAAIRSTVQLWERLPEHSRTHESQAAVVASVDRLNALVDRLLLFARSGHETRRVMDLTAVATEALELVRARAAAQGVHIVTDFSSKNSLVLGSPQALSQVVLNLVTNALQAMPAGGVLTCSIRPLGVETIELDVMDSGPGVSEEARSRIFEPFFTTRPDGTGLGLALCRELARQHGGDVTLEPGGPGAAFRLVLPLATGDSA